MNSICAGCGGCLSFDGSAVVVGSRWGERLRQDLEIRVCPRCRDLLVFKQTELAAAIKEVLA